MQYQIGITCIRYEVHKQRRINYGINPIYFNITTTLYFIINSILAPIQHNLNVLLPNILLQFA